MTARQDEQFVDRVVYVMEEYDGQRVLLKGDWLVETKREPALTARETSTPPLPKIGPRP